MRTVLITGGSGFFGEILKNRLLDDGVHCVNIDLEQDQISHPNLISVRGDIRNTDTLEKIFSRHKFDAIFHCAAILAHAVKDKNFLWTSNVDGTKNIAEFAEKYNVPRVIFTSSNCLWAKNFNRPVREDDRPEPVEIYGKSKWEGEKILLQYTDKFDVVIIRCPTIIESGRLGLLAILFEFIDEGRRVWLVGRGDNKYQFIYAQDLVDACIKAARLQRLRCLQHRFRQRKISEGSVRLRNRKSKHKSKGGESAETADAITDETCIFSENLSSRPISL